MAEQMRLTPIIILGTGGTSIDILDAINEINRLSAAPRYECMGFLDDSESAWGTAFHDVEVLGPLHAANQYPVASFVNGIGSDTNFWKKEQIIRKTGVPDCRFETIIHPSASVSQMSTLGTGVVILQHVTVAANVCIGNHVIVLPNSIISHDDQIGDYTSIAGGVCVSGGVHIGKSCYVGTNASIRSQVQIGAVALVGMGAVVLGDIPENTVVVGNPARFLRHTR